MEYIAFGLTFENKFLFSKSNSVETVFLKKYFLETNEFDFIFLKNFLGNKNNSCVWPFSSYVYLKLVLLYEE